MAKQVPNTITDKKMAELSRRAQKAQPSLFDKKVVQQRLASEAQRRKSSSS
jgi:hypothetical protein